MKLKNQWVISVVWIILGCILLALGVLEKVDGFWSGMGSSLLLIGILQLLRNYRLQKK